MSLIFCGGSHKIYSIFILLGGSLIMYMSHGGNYGNFGYNVNITYTYVLDLVVNEIIYRLKTSCCKYNQKGVHKIIGWLAFN
jgi:hypothetical protein